MFRKILIANRGEIACRVAATARRMGIQTVMVYSEADAKAVHVRQGDQAVCIGPAEPTLSYLRADRILQVALDTGAQAIHPGYGFLSENADFAQACDQAGVVFIGPPATAIRAMGLKAEAKRLMQAAGVPLVPGYHGADQGAGHLQQVADAIGYPVLIKASAGGGGKGMRVVMKASEFALALASCQREALSSFGDGAVLIERYLPRARHIEVQVFGDSQGNVVSLFERDCSVQRRHQKVIEEAPAPGLSEALRERLSQTAVAAAKAVGYVGAGTVEFITEPGLPGADGLFYFMEMNTRLQVEHPVTEAILGQDLVSWQFRVAAGEPLPCLLSPVQRQGHAIEVRLCAENPEAQFLPSTGRLSVCRWPVATRFTPAPVRIDTGVQEGDWVSPYFDSLLAKIIVWGETREQALARMAWALAQTHVLGLHTNLAFLRRVLGSRSFVEADLDTALIERERAELFGLPSLSLPWILAGAAAQVLSQSVQAVDGQWADPWSEPGAWRALAASQWQWSWQVAHRPVQVMVTRLADVMHLQWVEDGVTHRREWSFEPRGEGVFDVMLNQDHCRLTVYPLTASMASPKGWAIFSETLQGCVQAHQPWLTSVGAGIGGLRAPMPGKVLVMKVRVGDRVQQGQAVAVIEAMKMEHTLQAPLAGEVVECYFAQGDQVSEGAELLRLVAVETSKESVDSKL